jgi:hypothetical protein
VCLQHLRKFFTLRNTCYLLPPSSCHQALENIVRLRLAGWPSDLQLPSLSWKYFNRTVFLFILFPSV